MGYQQWRPFRKRGLSVQRLREIDRHIRFLTRRLECAEVADPGVHHGSDQVFFGATVTYANDEGATHTITILRLIEVDNLQGQKVSGSPVNAPCCAAVWVMWWCCKRLRASRLEVLDVSYPAPEGGNG